MADRTVTVRLKADISDFVTDIGVKAVAAVNKLERAADKSSGTLKKTAKDGAGIGDGVSAGATKATEEINKLAGAADKTMTATGEKVRKTAKEKFSKAGEEATKSFTESAKKGSGKSGEDVGKSFGAGLKKWLTGSGGAADAGKAGGTVFGSGFLGVLKTPILGPAVVAILTAAVVTALPAVGALAGGAFVTGFGAGLAGLGIMFAAKNEAVKKIWADTLRQLGADMELLAAPFQKTLTNIAGYLKRTVDDFNPAIAKAFADSAQPVDQFVNEIAAGLEKLIPAIDPVNRAFTAVLRELGPALQDVLGQLSDGLIELANSVERNPQALADFARGLGDIVKSALDLITTLNDVNTKFESLTGGLSLVEVTMKGVQATLGPLILMFAGLEKGLGLVNALTHSTDASGASMSAAANNTVALIQANGGLAQSAQHAAPAVKSVAERTAEAKKAAAEAKQKFEDFISTLFRLQNLSLTLSGAQIGLQAAIDAASASLKDNGRTLDINTEKGRANRSALNDIAKAANDQTESMIRAGKGTVSAAASADRSRASFVKIATQMGLSKTQAKALAAQLIAIPNVTREAKLTAQKKDLDAKLADARKQLADPKLTATKRAKLEAEIKQLLAAKAQAQAAIDSLHGKTVNLTTNVYRNMVETTTHRDVGVRVPAPTKADGGFHPGGYPSYADGKLPKQAMIAPGKGSGLVQWAEQETGGEAFIPLAPSKRDRSTKILGQVADSFGLGLVKSFADGGLNLPGGRLVDIAYLLRQLGIPFNPTAGINYAGTLKAVQSTKIAATGARANALNANNRETAARRDFNRLHTTVEQQKNYVEQLRKQGASQAVLHRENQELLALQGKMIASRHRLAAATRASNVADAVYKARAEAAAKATEAHKDAVEKLVEQQKAAVEMAGQIAQGLTSGANIGDLFAKSLTGKGLLADLQSKGAELKKFGDLITQLRGRKLDEDLIQQIVGKGAGQGTGIAQAILDGGAGLVAALNKAQENLDTQAEKIGAGSAAAKYGVNVAGARAGGGGVTAGMTYRVNELGQEWFTAPINGFVSPADMDPRRYIQSFAGSGSSDSRIVREIHHHQTNNFTGVSMAEADLIAQRAQAKADLMNRGY